MGQLSRNALRVALPALLALALALPSALAPAPATAATIHAVRAGARIHGAYRFNLAVLRGYYVLSAALVSGGRREMLPAALVRAASTRGTLRIRPTGALRSCRRGRCRLRLVVSTRLSGPPTVERPPRPRSLCTLAGFGTGVWPSACWRPYAAASVFNRPLAANPRLAPDSAGIVSTLVGWGTPTLSHHVTTPGSTTATDYGHPYYFGTAADPLYTVHCVEPWGRCADEGLRVHVPDRARAANGPDAHMAVIDQQNGWEYDLWQVRHKPPGGGELTVSWGGRTRIGTPDASGLGGGGTASGFGLLAGQIRAQEWLAGNIDHALFMTVRCDSGRSIYPADGVGSPCGGLARGSEPPAMGQHLFLALSDGQIDALGAPAYERTILRAMAHYGLFVGDTGGDPWDLALESDASYTSFGEPGQVLAAFRHFGASHYRDSTYDTYNLRMVAVDWARYLRVVNPCVDQGTC